MGRGAGDHDTPVSRRAKIDIHDIPAALLDEARLGAIRRHPARPGQGRRTGLRHRPAPDRRGARSVADRTGQVELDAEMAIGATKLIGEHLLRMDL